MDCVPSLDSIASMLISDLFEQDGFEFPDPTVPSTLISFGNPTGCHPMIENNTKSDRKRKDREASETRETEKGDEWKNKRMRHRDVERQRRHEVSCLFKTLRTLLPLQYVKGKRSSSDHVQQAANYIKDVQNRIKELREKRDEIKRSSDLEKRASGSTRSSAEECSSSSSKHCTCAEENNHMNAVVVPCLGGVEIVISCCFRNKFCLSSVLRVLAQELGFNVVRCTSTTLHSRHIHNIFSQVDEGRNVNFADLQEKIMNLRF